MDVQKEAPCAGMLLAIDSEFVALAPVESGFEIAGETQSKVAR